jgi:hypothetical protein
MPQYTMKIQLQNEKMSPIRIVLEPLWESFTIQPNQCVEIIALFESNKSNHTFTIAPNEDFLIVYAPGEVVGFIDCYLMSNGIRLTPDDDT